MDVHDVDTESTDLSVEDIMAQIREQIRNRQPQQPPVESRSETMTNTLAQSKQVGYAPYSDLYQARNSADAIRVSLSIVKRNHSIVDRLLGRLRYELHNLVIYYLNMLAAKQVIFNRSMVNVVSFIVEKVSEPEDRVTELEQEVQDLRQRLEALEQTIARS